MIPRIYHPHPLKESGTFSLGPKASQHCLRVLRLKSGDHVTLFCGDGHSYNGTLLDSKKEATVHIHSKSALSVESPVHIHLGQGLARHDRMDWIIQKAVECGVQEITPLIMTKSIVKFKEDRLEHKLDHWQQIVIAACEQSGRNTLPLLHEPVAFQNWVSQSNEATKILFQPGAKQSVKDIQSTTKSIQVLLGPESGLHDREIQAAHQHHFVDCHLGPRVLRTETATVAALTMIQAFFGDF